jgi:bacterial/archaeal transporter family protein
MPWYFYALVSAVAAAATAILSKLGVEGVPSSVATGIRTIVVLVLAWAVVLSAGHQRVLTNVSGRTLVFLGLSGVATAVSWLAYFRALQAAPASLVAPIDKLSLPFTILLASLVLREAVTLQQVAGVALMVAGALLAAR